SIRAKNARSSASPMRANVASPAGHVHRGTGRRARLAPLQPWPPPGKRHRLRTRTVLLSEHEATTTMDGTRYAPRSHADERFQAAAAAAVRGPRAIPGGRRGADAPPARRRGPGADGGVARQAARPDLDRRDHAGLHLLLLRRDAGPVPVPRA